jgi:integrase
MSRRIKTSYPGVYFREARRIGGKGAERIYYIVFKKNGKVHEEKVGRQFVDDLTPARAAGIRAERIEGKRKSRKEIREQKAAIKNPKETAWTFDRLWNEYKTCHVINKNIRIDEGRYNLYLKKPFGDKEPKDILLMDIDRLRLKSLKEKSPQTVVHVLNLFQRIVNFGVQRNLCSRIPFKIQKPKVNNLKTEDLTSEQLKNLLAAIDADNNIQAKNLMRLALFTGMRRGELFKLKWEDIDEHRGFISIRDPKGGPDQKIPLNDEARTVLKNHVQTGSEYVFPGRGGRLRTDINKQVNRIKKRAGLPKDFRPLHGLRHTYASMLASTGKVDLYTLQKLLTHKDSRMTQRYAHLRDEALKKASDLAGDIISNALNEKASEKVIDLKEQTKSEK